MASRARSRVRDAISALERRYGKAALMLTGTLPGSTPQAIKAFQKLSGVVVERVGQWMRDSAPNCPYVFVWELQARGALHCHIAIAGFHKNQLRRIKRTWHRYWVRLLRQLSNVAGIDLFESTNGSSWVSKPHVVRAWAQHVKKSIARYLSKYLSKGSGSERWSNSPYHLGDLAPGRWFSISRRCQRLVEQYSHGWHTGWMPGASAAHLFEAIAAELLGDYQLKFFFHGKVIHEDLTLIYYPVSHSLDAVQDAVMRRFPAPPVVSIPREELNLCPIAIMFDAIAHLSVGNFRRGARRLEAGL